MIEDTLLDAEDRMDKAVTALANTLDTIRTGRASTALVEHLHVTHYGQPMALNQLATLAAPEATLITVTPWDAGTVNTIMKAIQTSDLGINPNNDGVVIRLNFPPLTEERRKEYVKVVKHMAEEGRVAVRNIRRDARKHLEAAEKAGAISADELERAEKEMEKITHDHVDHIDKALGRKEQELLEV